MESVGLEERAGGGSRSSTVAYVVTGVSMLFTILILGNIEAIKTYSTILVCPW